MIRQSLVMLALLWATANVNAQDQSSGWKPVGKKLLSAWAADVKPQTPLPEYPRPQLKRTGNWQNLNGLWNYSILPADQQAAPRAFAGQILVPYPIESELSGVGKSVGKDQALWYVKKIKVAKNLLSNKLLLHFGAVDWRCDVYVNEKLVGTHEGGYDPFSFDITKYLKKGQDQDIAIRVWDPTDDGPQPRGKQINRPHGIWYTPVTGIWQTVWLESVGATYIEATKQTPDIDKGSLKLALDIVGTQPADQVQVIATAKGQVVAKVLQAADAPLDLSLPNAQLWSPDSPFLYDLEIKLLRNGKTIDQVSSYFAMRKISMQADETGMQRMLLNNKFVFQYGPLDQGWWPDGLYTAPTDEALAFDIIKTKEMGFNMIRKHIKVEPARWYRHCDSLGMLVWQDMPSGDLGGNSWDMHPGKISGNLLDKQRSEASENYHKKEWKAIMKNLHNFPSIVMWVPFNEAWGQFKTKEITEWTMAEDPSRLINSASGGNFLYTGHVLDIHNYPDPAMPDPQLFGKKEVLVLGEFGGLGLPVEGHNWQEKDNWGYQSFKNPEELFTRYKKLMKDLKKLIPLGLSAAVYTQTTDVEIETNGLMTYDRKVIKIPVQSLQEVHKPLYQKP